MLCRSLTFHNYSVPSLHAMLKHLLCPVCCVVRA
uniref:Uncharacterized protein n=1 Tax=Anguilla anguilla TaxID=7936 RepID=A0A0E9TTX3_ANGAN